MLFKIALRNTLRNWRNSISAILSLSAAVISLVVFDGYIENIKKIFIENSKFRQMLGDIIIDHKNSGNNLVPSIEYGMSLSEQADIKLFIKENIKNVDHILGNLIFQGTITNGQQSQIFFGRALELKEAAELRGKKWEWNVKFGSPLHLSESKNILALGQGLAKKLGCNWEPLALKTDFVYGSQTEKVNAFNCEMNDVQLTATTNTGQLNAIDLSIHAVMDAGYYELDGKYLQTSLENGQMLLNTDKISYFSVGLANSSHIEKNLKSINEFLNKKYPYLQASDWRKHNLGELFQKSMDFLFIFRNFIITVILVVSTLSVVNTMIKIVNSRVKEIGAMRSIGFLNKDIVKLFFYESICICFLGSIIGMFFSIFISISLNFSKISYNAGILSEPIFFYVKIIPFSYLQAMLLLFCVGTISNYIATRSIINSKIIENLNNV